MTKEQEYIGVDMNPETTTSKVDYKGFGFAYIYLAKFLFILFSIVIFCVIFIGLSSIDSSGLLGWRIAGFFIGIFCAIISYFVNNFFLSAYRNLAIIAKTNVDIVNKLEELNKTKELNQ